jgi:hypothetical protein
MKTMDDKIFTWAEGNYEAQIHKSPEPSAIQPWDFVVRSEESEPEETI